MVLETQSASYVARRLAEVGPRAYDPTPADLRAREAALRPLYGVGPAMEQVSEVRARWHDTEVPVRLLRPYGDAGGLLVYLHGGGWVTGTLDEFDALGRTLAAGTAMTVALIDYRLAPEHPYPAAVDDCWAALQWLVTGHAGRPVVLMGDSAGGNLAAVMSRRAVDAKTIQIGLQVLVYPVTDCDTTRPSYADPENQLLLDRDSMNWFWDRYVPDPDARSGAETSPLRAPRHAGLPYTIVVTAEHDVLRDEGEEYAHALRASGVPVELTRFEGQMHGFFTMTNILPGAVLAQRYVIDRTNAALDAVREGVGG